MVESSCISGLKKSLQAWLLIHLRFLMTHDLCLQVYRVSLFSVTKTAHPRGKWLRFTIFCFLRLLPPKLWGFSHSTRSLLLVATGTEFSTSSTIKHISLSTWRDMTRCLETLKPQMGPWKLGAKLRAHPSSHLSDPRLKTSAPEKMEPSATCDYVCCLSCLRSLIIYKSAFQVMFLG